MCRKSPRLVLCSLHEVRRRLGCVVNVTWDCIASQAAATTDRENITIEVQGQVGPKDELNLSSQSIIGTDLGIPLQLAYWGRRSAFGWEDEILPTCLAIPSPSTMMVCLWFS